MDQFYPVIANLNLEFNRGFVNSQIRVKYTIIKHLIIKNIIAV